MKLGAYLGKSSRILVIYSDVYLQKLWTVYEIACYLLATHESTSCMDILPISIAPLFFGALIAAYAVVPFFWLPYPMVFTIPWSLFSVVWAATRRTWHRDLASTRDRVVNFRYKDTSCFDPSDRPFVENNIETFLKVQQYVEFDASHEDIMQVFDRLVRASVMKTVDTLQSSQETKHLVVILCATYFAVQLDIISGLAQHHGFLDV